MSGIIQIAPTAYTSLTPLNSFAIYPAASLQFRLLQDNFIEIAGIVRRTSGSPAIGTAIATLPTGIRPNVDKVCFAQCTNFAFARFDLIASSGNLNWIGGDPTDYFVLAATISL